MTFDELKKLDEYQLALEAAAANEPIPPIPLAEEFSFVSTTITPENGVWYWSSKCGACTAVVPLTPDPFSGKNQIPLEDAGGSFTFRCSCGRETTARANEILAFPWPG